MQTLAATPSGMAMRLLLTIATMKKYTVYTTDVASTVLNTPIQEEVLVQPPKEYYHNRPNFFWGNEKGIVRPENIAKAMARAFVYNSTTYRTQRAEA
eukprot:201534-Amphidinium_carterae.2